MVAITNDTEILKAEDIDPSEIDGAAVAPSREGKSYINIPADIVTISTQDYPAEQRDLVRWLFGYCRKKNWTWSQAVAETKVSETVLARVWSDKYRYPLHEWVERTNKETKEKTRVRIDHQKAGQRIPLKRFCERIEEFRELTLERDSTGEIPIALTSVIEAVGNVCHEALVTRTIAIIYGDNQIGKSLALQYFKDKPGKRVRGQTILVRTPIADSAIIFFKELAEQCGISTEGNFERLRRKILDFFDDSMLLAVDEINLIFQFYKPDAVMKVMEFLREIHDVKRCGLVLCGDNDFRDAFAKGPHARLLRKIANRSDLPLQLDSVASKEDLNLVAVSYGLPPVPSHGEVSEVIEIINRESGLGKITKYLGRAKRVAVKKKERFNWGHFHATWKLSANCRKGLGSDKKEKAAPNDRVVIES